MPIDRLVSVADVSVEWRRKIECLPPPETSPMCRGGIGVTAWPESWLGWSRRLSMANERQGVYETRSAPRGRQHDILA